MQYATASDTALFSQQQLPAAPCDTLRGGRGPTASRIGNVGQTTRPETTPTSVTPMTQPVPTSPTTAAATTTEPKKSDPSDGKRRNSRPARRQRSAISGMIVTIILIGIVVSIGGILATTTTDLVQTGLVLDNVEIKRLAIQNTGTESYITGMVKNAGNTDITDVVVIVTLPTSAGTDSDGVFVAEFADTINSGVSATVNSKISRDVGTAAGEKVKPEHGGSDTAGTADTSRTDTTDADITAVRLSIGEEVLVEIRAQIVGGGEYSQTKVLTPQ